MDSGEEKSLSSGIQSGYRGLKESVEPSVKAIQSHPSEEDLSAMTITREGSSKRKPECKGAAERLSAEMGPKKENF